MPLFCWKPAGLATLETAQKLRAVGLLEQHLRGVIRKSSIKRGFSKSACLLH
jgi:hypothetical protein